jgi:hypothetical protein
MQRNARRNGSTAIDPSLDDWYRLVNVDRQRMPWEKQFDRSDAVRRAQRVFWKTGYEKSSLTA